MSKIYSKLISLILCSSFLIPGSSYAMPGYENEKIYSDKICKEELMGAPSDYGSYKPDCETHFAAVEFDWAIKNKIYECFGQALKYADLTNKIPVCYIMATNSDNYNLAEHFKNAAKLGGITLIIKMVSP